MYHEALEKQIELGDIWKGPVGREWAELYLPALLPQAATPLTASALQDIFSTELLLAEPYFITNKICRLLAFTKDTLPDVPLLTELVPTPTGWCYLEEPYPLLYPSALEKGKPPRLKAFCWGHYHLGNSGVAQDGLGLTFYEDMPLHPYPLEMMNWGFGFNWGDDWEKNDVFETQLTPIEPNISHARARAVRQYVLTLFSFLKQRIIVVSHERANRAARRRYEEHKHSEAPLIKVILLRVKTSVGGESHEEREIEWTCQWIVRGHWRQQWYRHDEVHRAIWIRPYIKGPEDKPLKKPISNLFAVVR